MEWLSARFSPRAFLWDWSQDAGLTAGFRLFSGVLGGFYRMAGVRLLLLMVCMCVCGASWGGQQRYSLYAGSREQGHTGDGARAASRHRYCKGTAKAYTSINKHREGERDLLLGSLMCVGGASLQHIEENTCTLIILTDSSTCLPLTWDRCLNEHTV